MVVKRLKHAQWGWIVLPLLLIVVIVSTVQIAYWTGWRINLTESEPLGIYRLEPVSGNIKRGALVEFCPPAFVTPDKFPFYMGGACPGGGMPMFKEIAGIPGDRVHVDTAGVWINGQRLPFSQQMAGSARFPEVRLPHQRGDFVLGKNEYWIYGSGAEPALAGQSFDSRYWGVAYRSMVYGILN